MRSFHLIASDGGLLERPLRSKIVLLAPGERAQIVVDLSDGRPAELRARSAGNMGMGGGSDFGVLDILPGISRRRGASLQRQLVSLPAADASVAVRQRRFVLDMGVGMMGGFTINGKSRDMQRIDERVPMNEWEIWQIENASMMAHPFHIHDVQFRILDRDGKPPTAGEQGLKDTVVVNPRERVRLLLRFEDYTDPDLPYMYHCVDTDCRNRPDREHSGRCIRRVIR